MDVNEEIADLIDRLEDLKEQKLNLEKDKAALDEKIKGFEAQDVDGIRKNMEEIEDINERVEANRRRARLIKQHEDDLAAATALDVKVEDVRKEKRARIAAAEFPLEGVEFDLDGKLILDGKPWHAWSDGERLLAAFEIAAAMSPNLKAVVMRQGSWLDNDSRKVIADIAKQKDYLVLMEIVGDSDEVQIYMNNGQVEDRRSQSSE